MKQNLKWLLEFHQPFFMFLPFMKEGKIKEEGISPFQKENGSFSYYSFFI